MVRTSVRVPKRQTMAWAVALAAGFVASTAVFTSHPAPQLAAGGDRALGGGRSSVVLPAGFQAPTLGAAPQSGPGITVLAAPTRGNAGLTVSETIRPGRPITSITLSPPQLPSGFDQGSVTIQNVVIVADGHTVVLDFTTLQGERVVPLGTSAQTVTVSYTLTGVRKPGSTNLLALRPITSVGDGVILPVSFVVAAKSTLTCPNLPTAVQGSCEGSTGTAAVTMLSGLASTQAALVIDLAPSSGTVVASGPTEQPTGAATAGGAATAAADNGSGGGSGSTVTAGPGSTDASSATATAGSGGAATTASSEPATTSTTPPTTDTPTSTTTTTPGTPTDTSTGVSPDPTATAPAPDPTPTAPITLPTGTATNGTDSTPASTPTGTTGSSVDGSSVNGSSAADAPAPAAASTPAAAPAPAAQQPTGGTTDPAPVVVTDPSTGGPSTESTESTGSTGSAGSGTEAVPADPAPVTTQTASTTEKAAETAPSTDASADATTAPTTDGATGSAPAAS